MTRRSRSRWFARVAAVVVVGVLCSSLSASAGEAPSKAPAAGNPDPGPGGYVIRLQSRTFKPAAGRHDPAGVRGQKEGTRAGRVHFLIQFDGIPDKPGAQLVADLFDDQKA